MTNDKDREKVEKVGAINAVKHLFGQGAMVVCAAIDALEPEPVCQDAVSRDVIWRAYCNYFGVDLPSEDGFAQVIKRLPSACTERSERGLPAPGRSEEEIRAAIRWFHSMLADSSALWGVSACVDLIRWMQGEENGWSKLFSAPDPADKEGGTDETD